MRILVVEDEPVLSRQVREALECAGYAVDCAANGEDADFLGQTESYDVIVLDLGLPLVDGLSVLQKWREAGISTPVLVLTARSGWSEIVLGIDTGADDYVTKPFRMEELLARLRALMRRTGGHTTTEFRMASITVDLKRARVTRKGNPVRLTSHEFRVLAYLLHQRGRVVPQRELSDHIYAQDQDRDSNTVEVSLHASVENWDIRCRSRRLEGAYPSEVQPLVDDLNDLLEQRERTVRQAQATAGDLAHALKTPLALLSREAEEARVRGLVALADAIMQHVGRMRQQVDYHLAQARAAGAGPALGTRCRVLDCVKGLERALSRLYMDRHIDVQIHVSSEHFVACQREDLDEMLGNLFENGHKWARSKVTVQSSGSGEELQIMIDDDGPGIPLPERAKVLRRGVRADETVSGSGLGLAIASSLAELYGGRIFIEDSPLGGLRARIHLPTPRQT